MLMASGTLPKWHGGRLLYSKKKSKPSGPQRQAMEGRMANGKMAVTLPFYSAERDLFRAGAEAFMAMLETTATNKLDGLGGIGPYKFKTDLKDGKVSPHLFIGEEG
jgi:hypothetical protein